MAAKGRKADGDVFVALLRGINVGGRRKVPMAELRALAEGLGWRAVATYIQSGNVVFRAAGTEGALEAALEQALAGHFGFDVPVVARSGEQWLTWARKSAFPDAEGERPKLLHLGLSKAPPAQDAVRGLAPYCAAGERVAVRGGALWVDCVGGVASSKLTPAVLDRVVGSSVTMRNWHSVQALAGLVRAARDD